MKHRIADDVNVNVKVDIPTDDVVEIVGAVKDAVVTVIAAAAAAHILKQFFTKEH